MPVFFNGRLLVSPTTASVVNDDAMRNQNLSVGNVVALIGKSAGGAPKVSLRYGSPQEAQRDLVSGELLDAVLAAFNPSAEVGGPDTVVAFRVNPALQATGVIKDASTATVINLTSTGYGLRENQIKYKVEAATTLGLRLTLQRGNDVYTQDNVARQAMSVVYTGAQGTATMTIIGTTLTLFAPAGTSVAAIDLATFPTVQELADRISQTAGFAATVLDGNGAQPTLNALDYVTAQSVKTTAYTAMATLQACVDWLNSNGEPLVTATRAAAVGTVPAVAAFDYLSGGSDGTVTNTDYSDCFTALQAVDVQWITPVTSDPAVHAMADAHCSYMSNVGRKERRAICGMAIGTTDVQAIAAAKLINSDRTSLVHLGYYDYNAAGVLTLYPAYMTAAMIAGAFSGVNPGTPLTNKTLKVRGWERKLRRPTDTDQLILGGVLCVEDTEQGYKVVKSISTWLVNTNYNRVEQSTGVAMDFTARNIRQALDVLRGQKANPLVLSRAVSIAESTLRELAKPEPEGPGVLAGNAANPAYKNITASVVGDVLAVSFQCSPVIPVNYVLATIYAVPFTGSATA